MSHAGPDSNRLGSLQCPAAGEHRQTFEHASLGRAQQIVAPVQRRLQRLLAWEGRATAAGQHSKTLIQALRQLLSRERLY